MRTDVHYSSDIPRMFRDAHHDRINIWLSDVSRGGDPFLNLVPRARTLVRPLPEPEATTGIVTLRATRTKLYEAGEIGSVGDRFDVSMTPESKPVVEAWMKAA